MTSPCRLTTVLTLITIIFLGYSQVYGQEDPLPETPSTTAWSDNGSHYALGFTNGRVEIFQKNGILETSIPNAHSNGSIFSIAFSPDSTRLVTAGEDRVARVWNTDTAEVLGEFNNVGLIISAIWGESGDYIWLIAAVDEHTIITSDIPSDIYTFSQNLRIASSYDAILKPDGTVIAFTGLISDVILVNPESREVLRHLDATPYTDFLNPANEFPLSLTWHPTENIVANGKVNGRVTVWNLDNPSNEIPILQLNASDGATDDAIPPFEYAVRDIMFSEDGRLLHTISADGTLRVWDAATGSLLSDTNISERLGVAAFSPGAVELIYMDASTEDGSPKILIKPNANAGSDQYVLNQNGNGTTVISLDGSESIDPDGTIADYFWLQNGVEIAIGVSPQIELGDGIYQINLVVVDDDGLVDIDVVNIVVQSQNSQNLRLTTICSLNPDTVRIWQVSNPNTTPVNFTWEVSGTTQTGSGTVPGGSEENPGVTTFETAAVATSDTVSISVGGTVQGSAASDSTAVTDTATLISAIANANNSAEINTICLADGTYTLTASNVIDYGDNGLPLITSDITLVGLGDNVVIERGAGAPAFRLLHVKDTGTLTLENLTLSNGNAGITHGGAVYARGALVELCDVLPHRNLPVPWTASQTQRAHF